MGHGHRYNFFTVSSLLYVVSLALVLFHHLIMIHEKQLQGCAVLQPSSTAAERLFLTSIKLAIIIEASVVLQSKMNVNVGIPVIDK